MALWRGVTSAIFLIQDETGSVALSRYAAVFILVVCGVICLKSAFSRQTTDEGVRR